MRLWSIHPKYLDKVGLIALWRESLLAKKVLERKTIGYRHHPQLIRFKNSENCLGSINKYLEFIYSESLKRKYSFDNSKFKRVGLIKKIPVSSGQIKFEFNHLVKKVKDRDPEKYLALKKVNKISVNPVFRVKKGEVEPWEIIR